MFQDIEIFHKCIKNVVGKNGLLEKRNFKVPSELKKISLIDLEKYNKEPYYSIIVENKSKNIEKHDNINTDDNLLEEISNISINDYKKIYIIFVFDITLFKTKKKLNEYNKYIDNIKNKENTDLVLVYTNSVKSMNYNYTLSKGFMDNYNFNNYHVINYKLLYINITNHIFVPKHEIISEQEKEDLINQYYLKNLHDLSCISYQDPQIIFIGGKINDVIKITRLSDTAETSIIYKLVTDRIIIK